jgi:hypothetical protein
MRRVTLRAGWLSWVLSPRRKHSAQRPRRSAVLELLRLEDRNPPSSVLNSAAGQRTTLDLRDLAPPMSPPIFTSLTEMLTPLSA